MEILILKTIWQDLNYTVREIEMGPAGTQVAFPAMRCLGPGIRLE